MIRSTVRRIARTAVVTGIGALVVLGGAGAAHATQTAAQYLSPGAEACTNQQYANFDVTGTGTATGQLPAGGAKFKLKLNGAPVANTPARANSVSFHRAAQLGNFTPGHYSLCATNTGNAPTYVTLDLRTNGGL